MPRITDEDDGTKTFSINTREVADLLDAVDRRVPGLKRLIRLADSQQVSQTVSFLRSAVN